MKALTYSYARQNFAKTMDEVIDDHSAVIVTRGTRSVVMMSLEDFNSWQETAALLSVPANAQRLLRSITSLERGEGLEHKLDE